MLEFLPLIEEICGPLSVWGMTSMHMLWLLAADDWQAPKLVSIWRGWGMFEISYQIPKAVAPFEGAVVRGYRESVDDAGVIVRLAMRLSDGWPDA
jgi:hypothetical protein